MSATVEDKMELLKEPLHGIYIPVALMIVGISIINVSYLPYVLVFLALLLGYRITNAYSKYKNELMESASVLTFG